MLQVIDSTPFELPSPSVWTLSFIHADCIFRHCMSPTWTAFYNILVNNFFLVKSGHF